MLNAPNGAELQNKFTSLGGDWRFELESIYKWTAVCCSTSFPENLEF